MVDIEKSRTILKNMATCTNPGDHRGKQANHKKKTMSNVNSSFLPAVSRLRKSWFSKLETPKLFCCKTMENPNLPRISWFLALSSPSQHHPRGRRTGEEQWDRHRSSRRMQAHCRFRAIANASGIALVDLTSDYTEYILGQEYGWILFKPFVTIENPPCNGGWRWYWWIHPGGSVWNNWSNTKI